MNETWKPVVGYEGLYEISDQGNIRTLYKTPPRLLKPGTGTSGYRYVQLTKDGTYLPKQIHRLVAEAFLGEIPDEVNHKNGIKTDNRLVNLEKATRSENMLHRVRVLGIRPIIYRGTDSGNARFTETQVKTIRRYYDQGMSGDKIAKLFKCSKGAVWHIIKRRSWSHI